MKPQICLVCAIYCHFISVVDYLQINSVYYSTLELLSQKFYIRNISLILFTHFLRDHRKRAASLLYLTYCCIEQMGCRITSSILTYVPITFQRILLHFKNYTFTATLLDQSQIKIIFGFMLLILPNLILRNMFNFWSIS